MYLKNRISFIFCAIIISLLLSRNAHGFIHREFTTHEILDASTNIVFGKFKSIDTKRMRAVIEIEEDVKGKSGLKEVQLNIAVGRYMRGSSPEMMMELLKVDLPVIIFFQQTFRVEALGYVNGTWFRTRTPSLSEWWSYTHLCPYMLRTFTGSTVDFQKVVRAILAGEKWVGAPKDAVKVLVLTGNSVPPIPVQSPVPVATTVTYEYSTIRGVHEAGKQELVYEATQDRDLPDLDDVKILWIGQGEVATHRYLLNKKTEDKIKDFVKKGGIVIVSGQYSRQTVKMDWLAGKLKAVQRPPTQEFQIAKVGEDLFTKPNPIKSGEVYIADAWTDWDRNFTPLATANGGKDLVVGTRKHGKGLYIVTSLLNDRQSAVRRNEKLIENILYFAVNRLR